MKYFNNIKNLDDLKKKYRDLALKNHPDVGGDTETMKSINAEYDLLFPMYKTMENVPSVETAQSTRSEFYTQNGWKGENYNSSITTKEIACIMREYIKDVHNNYRFSIRSEYNHIFITMTESPENPFVNPNVKHNQLNQYALSSDMDLTNEARSVMLDILKVLNSYRMDDSDGMIDYFHTNFYISMNIGSWDKDIKIVPREKKKTVSGVEYETVEITKTREYKTLAPRDIETPAEFKPGQRFQLKSGFNYGCIRGTVYQITEIKSYGLIKAYKMGKGYKNVCDGKTRGNSFHTMPEKFIAWVEKGVISFVELVEVTKTEEYTSSVRRPKKKTEINVNGVDVSEVNEPETKNDLNYSIFKDKDTRDDSDLWVMKILKTLSDSEYTELANKLKKIRGYYSKFKKGFIFRYDPSDELYKIAI